MAQSISFPSYSDRVRMSAVYKPQVHVGLDGQQLSPHTVSAGAQVPGPASRWLLSQPAVVS